MRAPAAQSEHLFTPNELGDEAGELDEHTRAYLINEYAGGEARLSGAGGARANAAGGGAAADAGGTGGSGGAALALTAQSFKRAAGRYFASEADVDRLITSGRSSGAGGGGPQHDTFSFALNTLEMEGEATALLVSDMFDYLNVTRRFNVPRERLSHFVLAVRDGYKDNPYHNWQHAVHVLHNAFLLLVYTPLGTGGVLTDLDVFALCIAALCHDVGHGGITNSFLTATSDPLALVYNDASVWENHHAATTFRVLNAASNNILSGLQVRRPCRTPRRTLPSALQGAHQSRSAPLPPHRFRVY